MAFVIEEVHVDDDAVEHADGRHSERAASKAHLFLDAGAAGVGVVCDKGGGSGRDAAEGGVPLGHATAVLLQFCCGTARVLVAVGDGLPGEPGRTVGPFGALGLQSATMVQI